MSSGVSSVSSVAASYLTGTGWSLVHTLTVALGGVLLLTVIMIGVWFIVRQLRGLM